jgi:hypothetical protein
MTYPQARSTLWRSIYNISLSNRYQTVIRTQTRHALEMLGRWVYAGRIQTQRALKLFRQNEVLSVLKVKDKKAINKKSALLLSLIALIAQLGSNSAQAANYSVDHLKLYAHSRILDYKEFQCFNRIITKESRWYYLAKNGSHFGLGQMRSKHYRDLDPYRQIDATLKYITNRYGTSCKAWAFHQERNYY